ncbi:hypothetical protein [Tropicimonas sp. IMCC6043]|uniref:hypothetical protein n=1 Tax=Tropicimonas sp. IMCC6043 TaxID=2510645 RepID=UPI00101C3DBB|nr:hypothetical protein [Tropicimonas sp. IMCC6043]RYH08091.1 hypothetical protein EU800_17510 [Tropicimonas sp. IMCC6043]
MSPLIRQALLVALITFGAALALRLPGVDLRAPWLDEIYSQFAISRDWYGLAADRISRGHSPLYFALMKALGIEGGNVVLMRTASVVFDAAGAAVLAGGLAKYVSTRAGLFFGLLYAASPLAIHWSQNARPYGLLMLFLGIGIAGALGLFATLGQGAAADGPRLRRPMRLFGWGFSLASLTMTAGIFAFVTLAALPFALPRSRNDAAFRARWRRAVKVPAIVSVLGYFAFSGPHIARQAEEGYWADKYNTLGLEGLVNLWNQVVFDGGLAAVIGPSGTLATTVTWVVSAALLLFALAGALACRDRPALLAPVLLLAGYVALLLCVSIWTSVLVPRYFLPALFCLLALAGSGMARLGNRAWSWFAILPLLALLASLGAAQSRLPGTPPDRSLEPVARIIARTPPENLRLLYEKEDDSRNRLISELFPLRYDRPDLGRPEMSSYRPDRLADAMAEGRDIFAYMTVPGLDAALASGAPPPACVHDFGDWALAYWGNDTAACAR